MLGRDLAGLTAEHAATFRLCGSSHLPEPMLSAATWRSGSFLHQIRCQEAAAVPFRGWPASGPGRLVPDPYFLTRVFAEAPRSSLTSRVRSPGTFTRSCRPAATVTFEVGGAGTYARRAIPGASAGRPRPASQSGPGLSGIVVGEDASLALAIPRVPDCRILYKKAISQAPEESLPWPTNG